ESELLVVGTGEHALHVGRQVPERPLEWAERLLARLVEELLVGVRRFPLVLRALTQPLVDLRAHIRGEILEQHVLKVRREVNLRGLALGEVVEGGVRQRRRAVLYGAGEAVFLARNLRESLE